jgi:hypothetical protein
MNRCVLAATFLPSVMPSPGVTKLVYYWISATTQLVEVQVTDITLINMFILSLTTNVAVTNLFNYLKI